MVLTDTRLDKAGVKRFRKLVEGKGSYGVIGEPSIREEGGGLSAGVMVVYRTDQLYRGRIALCADTREGDGSAILKCWRTDVSENSLVCLFIFKLFEFFSGVWTG